MTFLSNRVNNNYAEVYQTWKMTYEKLRFVFVLLISVGVLDSSFFIHKQNWLNVQN